jgi:hypothetical protein
MSGRHITSGDRRARALTLNPRKRQNNAECRLFVIPKAATLGENMEKERIARALGYRD